MRAVPGAEIDVDELAERLQAPDAVVVDVREPDEYADGHVPGALALPLMDVPERFEEIATSGPVLVICASGGRSRRAADFLIEHGVDAINVTGGTRAWVDSGRAVVQGDEPG